jgi:hypothetical protein
MATAKEPAPHQRKSPQMKLALWEYMCVLCSMVLEEDADHLFFRCSFETKIWNDILLMNEKTLALVSQLLTLLHRMSRGTINQSQRIAATCWNLKERNQCIFQNTRRLSERLFMQIVVDCLLWEHI